MSRFASHVVRSFDHVPTYPAQLIKAGGVVKNLHKVQVQGYEEREINGDTIRSTDQQFLIMQRELLDSIPARQDVIVWQSKRYQIMNDTEGQGKEVYLIHGRLI